MLATVLSTNLIIVFFILIFISLGVACYFLLTETKHSNRTVKSLTVRITLSFLLFGFLILGFKMGWLHPHALGESPVAVAPTATP